VIKSDILLEKRVEIVLKKERKIVTGEVASHLGGRGTTTKKSGK